MVVGTKEPTANALRMWSLQKHAGNNVKLKNLEENGK